MDFIDPFLISDPWYVVYCKPGREFYVAHILNNQLGLTVYLPEIEIRQHKEPVKVPFFPGYLFLQANLQKTGLDRINSSPGVLKLLDFGDGPLVLPQTLIEMIREEVNKHNGLSHQELLPGDSVRVTEGPLEGITAVFVESLTSGERARVLLHFLGRLSKVCVDTHCLEKLTSAHLNNQSLRRIRRTRGKGRRIK